MRVSDKKFQEDTIHFTVEGVELIGNGRTGTIIGLDEEGKKFIEKIGETEGSYSIEEGDEELFGALEGGDYFKTEKSEKTKLSSAYVHVTDNCNLHCKGCYSYINERNSKNDLPLSSFQHIMDELAGLNAKAIVISGGEPFFRKDLDEICKYAKSKGFKVDVISNGTMPLNVYEKVIPYIDVLNISVDGYDEITSFIRDKGIMPTVLATIEELKDKIALHMIVTLHKRNAAYMAEYLELSRKLGIGFNFSLLTASVDNPEFKDYILGPEEFKKMQVYLKSANIQVADTALESIGLHCRKVCGAGKKLISVGADGTIYPCHMLHISELALGNIMETPLSDLLNSDKNPFRNLSVDDVEGCKDCEYKYFCGGGCRARSFLSTQSIYQKCDLCETNLEFTKDNFSRLKAMYGI